MSGPSACQRCYHTRLLVCQRKELQQAHSDAGREARRLKHTCPKRELLCATLQLSRMEVSQLDLCTELPDAGLLEYVNEGTIGKATFVKLAHC